MLDGCAVRWEIVMQRPMPERRDDNGGIGRVLLFLVKGEDGLAAGLREYNAGEKIKLWAVELAMTRQEDVNSANDCHHAQRYGSGARGLFGRKNGQYARPDCHGFAGVGRKTARKGPYLQLCICNISSFCKAIEGLCN